MIRNPPRKGSTAMVALSLSAALLGVQVCAAQEPVAAAEERTAESTDSVAGTVYVEEVIVTAERLKKGAMPTQSAIVQTYDALRRGKRLYNARRYEEALPYLLMAAKRGFKWAQAMAGDIYLHGRGRAPRHIESGMGWLGVAARPRTAAVIGNYFRQAMAEIPAGDHARIEDVVAHYREEWSSRHWRVSCRHRIAGSPMGMGAMSLRLNKRMSCVFADEVPVCREPLYAVDDVLDPTVPTPFGWICPPVNG